MEDDRDMTGKEEKTSPARLRQAKEKRERIIAGAMELFRRSCVEDASMEEIAKCAGVGVATVYRYFQTKIELVIAAAEAYWEQVSEEYLKRLNRPAASGAEKLQNLFGIFMDIFREQKPFLKFLQEFDVFVKKYEIPKERLSDYESGILKLKPGVTGILEEGRKDGSLRLTGTVDETYFSLMHTILSLMEKLAANGDILSSDQEVDGERQVQIMLEIILQGLQAPPSDADV